MNADQQFLEYVIKALVDNPEQVKIVRTVDEMGVLLTLEVGAADMGKIIGRQGNTAKSIRTLLRVVGMKNNSRVNLKINEPVGGLKSAERMAAAAPTLSPTPTSKTLDEAMADLKLE
ncbi:MAG TPA: KH domain-containing protein [Candidatus Paceibacterota bacterium]|nr:KH domain-containing protein [Candidatus Paceibacterota bacterium]